MNFLSPWFLAGALLIAGPIVAHLIRRRTRDRVAFSATRFLDASAPRLQRRSRLQHPWLLALRCLIVVVLALAFARPFVTREIPAVASARPPQAVVAVLDESASMQRTGLWEEARARVQQVAADLHETDSFILLGVGTGVTRLIEESRWRETPPAERADLIRAVLDSREPGWGASHLDTGIQAALEEVEELAESEAGPARSRIVLISDFTAGTRLAHLAGQVWPADSELVLDQLQPVNPGNAGLQWLGWGAETSTGASTVRIRIQQNPRAPGSTLRLRLFDTSTGEPLGSPEEIGFFSGEFHLAALTVPAEAAGPFRVELEGDAEAYDNTLWFARPEPRQAALGYVGRHRSADAAAPRFYLERALRGWTDPRVEILPVDPAEPDSAVLASSNIFIIAEPLAAPAAASLRQQLEQGAFAVVLAADPARIAAAEALAGESGWTPGRFAGENALLGRIDFQHALFQAFADPRYSNFASIRFWQPQPLQLPPNSPTSVVAEFEDGSAAVTETAVGLGRLIVWGGDWAPASSQWVLSTKFVPWLQLLLERAAGGPARPQIGVVGEAQRLAEADALWKSGFQPEAPFTSSVPEAPGAYQIRTGDQVRWVTLTVPPEETRTEPLSLDALEQLGAPLAAAESRSLPTDSPLASHQQAREIEARQSLWQWLLALAAACLAAESVSAAWAARREPEGVAANP